MGLVKLRRPSENYRIKKLPTVAFEPSVTLGGRRLIHLTKGSDEKKKTPFIYLCYIMAKWRKYQGVFEVKSRVKTRQVRGIWSQQLEH